MPIFVWIGLEEPFISYLEGSNKGQNTFLGPPPGATALRAPSTGGVKIIYMRLQGELRGWVPPDSPRRADSPTGLSSKGSDQSF